MEFLISFLFYSAIGVCIYLSAKYLLTPLLPFILAFAVAAMSQKAVNFFVSKTFLSHKMSVTVITLVIITITALAVYGIIYSLFRELTVLLELFTEQDISKIGNNISDRVLSFLERFESLKGIGRLAEKFKTAVSKADDVIIKTLSQYMPSLVSGVIKFLGMFPKAVIFTTFFLISLFYIGFDYDKITSFFKIQAKEKLNRGINETIILFTATLRKTVRAYVLLTFITFIQLLCGFIILKIDYTFVLSLIICIVDLLPILGTGTILIPWSIFSFISGNFVQGGGILTLYIVITVFRQFAEPKIVGTHIGLNPLISLISMYAGLKTLGFWGIILFPIFTATVIGLNEKGIINLYQNPPETENSKAVKVRKKFLDFKKHDKKK